MTNRPISGPKCAGVAELADAKGLGPFVRKDLQVRFLSPAPLTHSP